MTEREVFEAALELQQEDRIRFLDGACAGDQLLHLREVRVLHGFSEFA